MTAIVSLLFSDVAVTAKRTWQSGRANRNLRRRNGSRRVAALFSTGPVIRAAARAYFTVTLTVSEPQNTKLAAPLKPLPGV
jgi:hypothetical protein